MDKANLADPKIRFICDYICDVFDGVIGLFKEESRPHIKLALIIKNSKETDGNLIFGEMSFEEIQEVVSEMQESTTTKITPIRPQKPELN